MSMLVTRGMKLMTLNIEKACLRLYIVLQLVILFLG